MKRSLLGVAGLAAVPVILAGIMGIHTPSTTSALHIRLTDSGPSGQCDSGEGSSASVSNLLDAMAFNALLAGGSNSVPVNASVHLNSAQMTELNQAVTSNASPPAWIASWYAANGGRASKDFSDLTNFLNASSCQITGTFRW